MSPIAEIAGFFECMRVWAATTFIVSAATLAAGFFLARKAGQTFALSDGLTFGAAGGCIGSLAGIGVCTLLDDTASFSLQAVVSATSLGLVAGVIVGALTGLVATWVGVRRGRAR